VYPCHHAHGTQEFVLSKKGDIRVAAMDFDNCLDRGNGDGSVAIWPCHDTGGNQFWKWDAATGLLSDQSGSLCVEVRKEQTSQSPFRLALIACDASKSSQQWQIRDAVAEE
jgi:polypeptide N-acetylgalactosaminyltransferase